MSSKVKKTISMISAAALTTVFFTSNCVFAETDLTTFPYTLECENLEGAEVWTSIYETQIPGYSGDGFAYLTSNEITFNVTVPEDDIYEIDVKYAQILSEGGRQQTISINGVDFMYTFPYADEWTDGSFGVHRLNKGENTITLKPLYGYAAFDTITVKKAELPELKVSPTLSDKKATSETQSLMYYLTSVYGKNVLSGQQEIYGGGHGVSTSIRYDAEKKQCIDSDGKIYDIRDEVETEADDHSKFVWHCWDENGQEYTYDTQNRNYKYNEYDREIKYLKELTGDAPAIRGFDFGSNCPCYQWDDGVTDRMIDWAVNQNGICTASWHINVPTTKASYTLGEPLDFALTTYSEKTDFVTANVMVEGTMEYDYFRLCMDNIAQQFLELQEAGVPVLWRPFHEAEGNPSRTDDPIDGSGAWFWWSKEGANVYKELWKYLYTTLTEEYGIHNLIWEQNLYAWSEASGQWYVGDEWVDIVGFDKYDTQYNRHDGLTSGPNESANSDVFWSLVDYVDNKKMVCMPENSTIPSVPNMTIEHANWLYFCTWYDEESSPKFISGEDYNNQDTVKATYQSDYCITLSELPKNLYTMNSSDIPPAESETEETTVTTSESTKPSETTSETKPSETTVSSDETVTDTSDTGNSDTSGSEIKATLLGDANNDGSIDIKDVAFLSQYIVKLIDIDPQQFANADVIADNDVTIKDLSQIKRYLIEEITKF